jgi:hypothetical protein
MTRVHNRFTEHNNTRRETNSKSTLSADGSDTFPAKWKHFCIRNYVSRFRRTIMANGTGTVDEIRPQIILAHTLPSLPCTIIPQVPFIESPSAAALSQRQPTPDGTSRQNRRALEYVKRKALIILRNTVITALWNKHINPFTTAVTNV